MAYDFTAAEKKWQEHWERSGAFRTEDGSARPKFYCLAQFPYPSGAGLHMGHVEIYTYADIIARFKLHQGFEVLHPMGFDAFGLPTENHAIKEGLHPAIITERNCANFRRQLKDMGFSYDWSREVTTSDPAYYRWTQWIWKRLYEKGLAYKAEVPVNWCDTCRIVAANEEVDAEGLHERCGKPTRARRRSQWMFRITAYAEQLLKGLEELDWPESSKKAQRDWIGRSEGATVFFGLAEHEGRIEVYTTRPDTLFGATYMVLAPEHPLVGRITVPGERAAVKAYVERAAGRSEFERGELNKEKTGVATGAYAINPVNGERIPVWVADYVLMSYGTGAIMAVPAHDERDFEFARVHKLPVIEVVRPEGAAPSTLEQAHTGEGVMVNSRHGDLDLDGLRQREAVAKTIAWLEAKGLGQRKVNYRLRDWVFARQRYWGEPFPIYYLENGAAALLDDGDLPLELPEVESYQPTDNGESPLAPLENWIRFKDRQGRTGRRESDTMPNWAGSCWYYLRFMDPHNSREFATLERQRRWGRVDVYVGGTEHLNLHDLYSRFWQRALFDLGLVAEPEPFQKLLHQGMMLGPDGSKMSKSAGNVVNPDQILVDHGTDVLRLNLCFMGPVEANKPWSEEGLFAMRRFIGRVERLYAEHEAWEEGEGELAARIALHRTVKAVTADMERYRFNTAIARLMELLNELQRQVRRGRKALEAFAVMLSPFAPHFAEEMWERLGHGGGITRAPYPGFDESLCAEEEVEIAVQFNGKIRLRAKVPGGLGAAELQARMLELPEVREKLAGKPPLKVIAVPGRLVNIILGGG